jgi:pyrroline-5-carboxylate reductase
MTQLRSILLIGCGNMGGAMLTGWLAAGMDPASGSG